MTCSRPRLGTWTSTPRTVNRPGGSPLGRGAHFKHRILQIELLYPTHRPALADTLYGGRSLEAASNIVFSNGLLDPWSSGGVLKPVGGTAALIIPEGAHHLDLRAANPDDPVSVVDARKKERYVRKTFDFSNITICLAGSSLRSGSSSGRRIERS